MPLDRFMVAIVVGAFTLMGCSLIGEDSGTQRDGYNLFVANFGYDEVFIVDLRTGELVNVLRGFKDVYSIAITRSGGKLYVGAGDARDNRLGPGSLYSCEIRSLDCDRILDRPAEPYTTPNGDVLVFLRERSGSASPIGRLDTLSDDITLFDTLSVEYSWTNQQRVAFHPLLPIFYTISADGEVFSYDYEKQQVGRSYGSAGRTSRMIVSTDGNLLFQAGGPIIDLATGEVVGALGGNPLGSLALSSSGDTLLLTDPGKYLIPEPVPSGKISLYNTKELRYAGAITAPKVPGMGAGPITDRIVLSPDGKTAYVSNYLSKVFVLDLPSGTVTDVIEPRETSIQIIALAVAPRP